jgi:hypothetical protein
MNKDEVLAHFQSLGGHHFERQLADGRELIAMQLRNSTISEEDLAMLEHLANQVDLVGLENTSVTDAGLKHLCRLPKLDNIDLANTEITDAGLDILSSIKSLEWLCLENTNVTRAGVERFEAAVPGCYVTWDERPV